MKFKLQRTKGQWRWCHPSRWCSAKFTAKANCKDPPRMTLARPQSLKDSQSSTNDPQQQRLFTVGVITDIQHADIPDGFSFHGVPRYYRNALVALHRAVDSWTATGIDFTIHFGDIIDGFQPKEHSSKVLSDIIAALDRTHKPHYHMLGNHCFYNLPRATLNHMLNIPEAEGGASYYSFSPHPSYKIIILDGYDISLLGWPEGHPHHQQAQQILDERNPNAEKNSPEGLEGLDRRFVKFGGGASARQLAWLALELAAAEAAAQKVLVGCHLPLCPGTAPAACLLWNYEEVLQLLRRSGIVAVTICGHAHQNGYVLDGAGIHHVVLPSVLETPPGRDAFGVLEVYERCLVLRGADTMMSLRMEVKGRQRVKARAL